MPIILGTAPVSAIATYTDLVEEIRDLCDNDSYEEAKIARAIAKAEAWFARKLRVADMEISTTLPVTAATATLPSDCRELRAVIWLGDSEYPLRQMSLAGLADEYGGETGSYPSAYAVEGGALRLGFVGSGAVRIIYYADLTPLSDNYPSNWLLRAAPDLYVAGVMHEIALRERDSAGFEMWGQKAIILASAVQEEGNRASYGSMVPAGIKQVSGARI